LNFIRKYWKQMGVALIAGLIVLGVSILWGRLYVAQGEIAKLTGDIELLQVRELGWSAALEECLEANKEWAEAYEDLFNSSRQLATDRDTYREEMEKAQEALEEALEPPADLEASVTSADCSTALEELLEALDWGPEVVTASPAAVEEELPLYERDGVTFTSFIHECCDCALRHRVTIQQTVDAFGFPAIMTRWVRLNQETELQRRLRWGPRWNRQRMDPFDGLTADDR
jgi:hypothetical protein